MFGGWRRSGYRRTGAEGTAQPARCSVLPSTVSLLSRFVFGTPGIYFIPSFSPFSSKAIDSLIRLSLVSARLATAIQPTYCLLYDGAKESKNERALG